MPLRSTPGASATTTECHRGKWLGEKSIGIIEPP
jgi:hypothetical protein